IAGFGWGAAWLGPDGGLRTHRTTRAFRDDAEGRARLGEAETRALLVHLRRPSRLSTLTLADAQPFADPAGRFTFAHNGDFRDWRSWRERYRAAGRIAGRADSEVGARWLEDAWDGCPPADVLGELHRTLGGQANLALLTSAGTGHVYAGNSENPLFGFRLDGIAVVSSGIHSLDRSLFRLVVPDARERRLVRAGETVTLG
ncbi:MAG TPA: hypothetical protein VNJ28_03475, partial [Candidatus Limnocylindrales bacterium]|nr:hypothetical protein [Candidatus Limnocylindrales bacterium]